MNTMQEFVAHAQHVERGRWTSVGSPVGPLRMLLPPVGLHDVAPHMGPVPALGEHTAAILGELGIDVEPWLSGVPAASSTPAARR